MKRKSNGDGNVTTTVICTSQQFHRPRLLSTFFLFIFISLILSPIVHAQKTDVTSSTSSTTAISTKTIIVSVTGLTTLVTSTTTVPSQTTLQVAENTSPISIPQPFDTTNLADTGSNFTSTSCPQFMRTFLADASFRACVPFSMLLYTSANFIALTRTGSFAVSQVLDASCGVSPKACGAIMDVIAAKLVLDTNCGQDIKEQNPIALQALTGLQNYLLYYGASCLKDPSTNIYCYTLAITNTSNPADAAAYYLPTIRMLSGARPSCSPCIQSLFQTYFTFSSNSTLMISQTYLEAAQVVNLNCGLGFVSTSYTEKESNARKLYVPHGLVVASIGIAMALWTTF